MPQPRWTTDEQYQFLMTHVESFLQHHAQGRQDEFYTALFQAFLSRWAIDKRPTNEKLRHLLKAKARTDKQVQLKNEKQRLKKLNGGTPFPVDLNEQQELTVDNEGREEQNNDDDDDGGPEVLNAVSDEEAIRLAIRSRREQIRSWFRRQLLPQKAAIKAEEKQLNVNHSKKNKDTGPKKRQNIWVFNNLYWEPSGAKDEYDRLVAEGIAKGGVKKAIQGGIRSTVLKQFYAQATFEVKAHVEAVRDQQHDEAKKEAKLAKDALKGKFKDASVTDRQSFIEAFMTASNEFACSWSQTLGWDVTIFSAGPNAEMDGRLAIHLFGGKMTKEGNGFRKATTNFRERVLEPYKQYLGFHFHDYAKSAQKYDTDDDIDDSAKWDLGVGLTGDDEDENTITEGESTTVENIFNPVHIVNESFPPAHKAQKHPNHKSAQCDSEEAQDSNAEDDEDSGWNSDDNKTTGEDEDDGEDDGSIIPSPAVSPTPLVEEKAAPARKKQSLLPPSTVSSLASVTGAPLPRIPASPPQFHIQETGCVPVMNPDGEMIPGENVTDGVTGTASPIGPLRSGMQIIATPTNSESPRCFAPAIVSEDGSAGAESSTRPGGAEIMRGRRRQRGRSRGGGKQDGETLGDDVDTGNVDAGNIDETMVRRSARKRPLPKDDSSLAAQQPKAKKKHSWHYEKIHPDDSRHDE